MASSHIIRLGKLKGENGVLEALRHNKRTLPTKRGISTHIDASRTPLNYPLASGDKPEAIALLAKIQMLKAGINKPRKNGVMAVEIIYSLPTDRHSQDTRPFFTGCYEWTKLNFAGELLAFDIHLDEAAPHAHAIILPLIDSRMQGNSMVGSTGNLMRLINKFHLDVASHYGLSKSDKARLSAIDKQKIEKLVLAHLKHNNDPVMQSCVWSCIRDLIGKEPLPFAQMLSIPLPFAIPTIIKVSSAIT